MKGINCSELGDPSLINLGFKDCYSTGLQHNDICSSEDYDEYYHEPDGSMAYDVINEDYNTEYCQDADLDKVFLWRCIKGKTIESIEWSLNL